jgi:hypothetical protein
MKKMNIATANPVSLKIYEFFSVKIRGTCRWTSFGKKNKLWEGPGILKRSHHPKPKNGLKNFIGDLRESNS